MTTSMHPYHDPSPQLAATLSYPQPGTVVCTAAGEVDSSSAPLLWEQLQKATTGQTRCLVVDLSAVTFFAVRCLRVLDQASAALSHGQEMVLVSNARAVLRMLHACDAAYPRYPELGQALASCPQPGPGGHRSGETTP
jgi:anti-sigma B factor antagonist